MLGSRFAATRSHTHTPITFCLSHHKTRSANSWAPPEPQAPLDTRVNLKVQQSLGFSAYSGQNSIGLVNVWLSSPVTCFKACSVQSVSGSSCAVSGGGTVFQEVALFRLFVWLTRTIWWKLQGAAKHAVNAQWGCLRQTRLIDVSACCDVIFTLLSGRARKRLEVHVPSRHSAKREQRLGQQGAFRKYRNSRHHKETHNSC